MNHRFHQSNRDPTDPLYIFSKPIIHTNSDEVEFYELNRESPLEHFYLKDKIKTRNDLHLLSIGNANINRESPILKRKKELHFPDTIFMKDDIEELGLNKQSRRFDQEILNSLDFQNELSVFVQAKQMNSSKQEKTQNKTRKKNPLLDIPQISSELYQSHYHYLPPEYLSPLFMSSPKYVFKALLKGDKFYIDQLSDLISKEKRSKLLTKYLSNRAFGFISINLYRMAIKDCNTSISLDKYNTFAYYLKGVILLFEQNELPAINVWRSSLQLDYYDHYSLLMKHLIQDHNIRHTLFNLQNNMREFIYFTEKYCPSTIYYSDDVQIGFKKLIDGFPKEAADQFENILQIKPNDEKAKIGHSIALYQKGEYVLSSKGFAKQESIRHLSPEYSKFFGIVNASLHYDKNAVENFSNSIQSNPTDYDSILLRAEVQIERGHYKMAIRDLLSIPDNLRTDKVFVLVAECYAWMGKLQKTLDALRFVSPNYEDSSLYLCHFIVARDHCDYEEAMNCIKKAVYLNPSFNLLRTAGDYFYSNACFADAISFYQMALENRKNSPSVLRSLAFALIHNGNEMEGAKILKNIRKMSSGGDCNFSNNLCPTPTTPINSAGGEWAMGQNMRYFDQWVYDFGSIEVTRQDRIDARMNPFAPLLKNDTTDYRYILHLMNIIDMPFELAVRDKIVDCGKGRMPFNRNKISIPTVGSNSSEVTTTISLDSSSEDAIKVETNDNFDEATIKLDSKLDNNENSNNDDNDNANSETPETTETTEVLLDQEPQRKKKEPIIEDAERLGMKCIPITYEVIQNVRVIRALGLSVLYLAHYMRSEMNQLIEFDRIHTKIGEPRPQMSLSHWTKSLDGVRAILQIADFKQDVKWISQRISSYQPQTSIVSAPPPNECFGFKSRDDESIKNKTIPPQPTLLSLTPKNSATATSESKESNNQDELSTTATTSPPDTHHHHHKKRVKRKVTTTPAPFKRPMRPYTGNPFEDQYVDTHNAPMYFIQSGSRLPPRFQHVSNAVFIKLAIAATAMVTDRRRGFSNSELSEISKSAKRLYRIVQKDISSVRKYDNGRTRLQAPTITLRYLGALGYEVYVTPPLSPKHRMRYYLCIEDCWTELIKGGAQTILFNAEIEEIQKVKAKLAESDDDFENQEETDFESPSNSSNEEEDEYDPNKNDPSQPPDITDNNGDEFNGNNSNSDVDDENNNNDDVDDENNNNDDVDDENNSNNSDLDNANGNNSDLDNANGNNSDLDNANSNNSNSDGDLDNAYNNNNSDGDLDNAYNNNNSNNSDGDLDNAENNNNNNSDGDLDNADNNNNSDVDLDNADNNNNSDVDLDNANGNNSDDDVDDENNTNDDDDLEEDINNNENDSTGSAAAVAENERSRNSDTNSDDERVAACGIIEDDSYEQNDDIMADSFGYKRRSHYRNQGQLSMVVMLLWMLHPFSCYSPEVGHIVLHAHLLACADEEVDKIDSVDEMFIEQMVDPDIQKMRDLFKQIIQKRKPSTIRPESISYFDTQRSLREIMNLINS